jgi:hypothetical protein
MNQCRSLVARRHVLHSATMNLCGPLLVAALPLTALGSQPIVAVEEDWELVVGEPDAACQAPQVTSIMSPKADLQGRYFAFDLNHQSLPEFHGGGMQTQAWNYEEPDLSQNYPSDDTLQHDSETVTWTQRLSVSGGFLKFEVVNGDSVTWGHFGGSPLTVSTVATMENLNSYDPAVSVANSGVGYASNRVHSLKLKAVRCYSAAGLVSEDSASRVVYQHTE